MNRFPFCLVAAGSLIILSAACSTSVPAPAAPGVDAGELNREVIESTAVDRPYRLVFDWSVNEPDLRVSGRGVARVEPPYRARLDLFSANGERILVAALVDDEVRVPDGLPATVPPGPLLWGVLGVLRPGIAARPSGGAMDNGRPLRIDYQMAGGGRLEVNLASESRLARMDLVDSAGNREEVRLEFEAGERFPRLAVYRHFAAVRELRLTLEQVEHVESYPTDIWTPGS